MELFSHFLLYPQSRLTHTFVLVMMHLCKLKYARVYKIVQNLNIYSCNMHINKAVIFIQKHQL